MVCAAWLCDNGIFSLGIVLFIFSLLTGVGALLDAWICWIWGEGREDTPIAARDRTAKEPPMSRAA